jgi:hypothetical protein
MLVIVNLHSSKGFWLYEAVKFAAMTDENKKAEKTNH